MTPEERERERREVLGEALGAFALFAWLIAVGVIFLAVVL